MKNDGCDGSVHMDVPRARARVTELTSKPVISVTNTVLAVLGHTRHSYMARTDTANNLTSI